MTAKPNEDVVLQFISTPQTLTTETRVGGVTTGAGAGAGATAGAGAGGLGRRLLAAARGGHTAQVLELMAAGAPFTADWLGTSALHLAAAGAHLHTCAVLLRAGVSRDARTKVERTPLHLAAHRGHLQVAQLLLRHGAAPDPRDMLRMTPLHWAAERGHAALAALLVRHGADLAALNKFGKTPPQLARTRGHEHVTRALEEAARERDARRAVAELRADTEAVAAVAAVAALAEPTVEVPASERRGAPESAESSGLQEPADSAAPPEPAAGDEDAAQAQEAAAALLARHGIAPLPRDEGSTVLTAIQSGRTVVLSDAGKLMLKDTVPPPAPASAPAPAPPAGGEGGGGAPQPGVKIFTLDDNGGLRPLNKTRTVKRIINPQDLQTKAASAQEASPPKAKRRQAAPVKIIMNKANFDRLLSGAGRPRRTDATDAEAARTQLAAALRAVSALSREVAALKARLANYEPV